MDIGQIFHEAIVSIGTNKLRSGLTILGIVIGVAAVIALLGIGYGAEASITGSIESIGTNLLFINQESSESMRNPRPLTIQDAEALSDPFSTTSVLRSAPLLRGSVVATYNGVSTTTTLNGTTPQYMDMRSDVLSEGEFLSEEHVLGRSSVVVIGAETARALFGYSSGIIGESIRIENQPFSIIGVLEEKGGSGFINEDDRLIIPITTAQVRLLHRPSAGQVDTILLEATSSEEVILARDEAAEILRQRHHTPVGIDDFSITAQQDFLESAQSITGVLTIFLGGIAAISLLVGGIGIMNIMLVSVTERTQEIGLRKALGARRKDILFQFLSESMTLSLLGGGLGIALGWLISYAISQLALASGTPLQPVLAPAVILMATLFSLAVGLFFGIYPASRAATLQPVDALRHE